MPTRPKIQVSGPFRARAIRGPREDGRWYWRIERYTGGAALTAWTGWATPEEATRACADLVVGGQVRHAPEVALTVDRLLRRWVAQQEDRGDLRPATVEACRQTGRRIAASSLGAVLVERVTRQTLERWRDEQLRAGRASRTLELDAGKLAQAVRWAREVGMVDVPDLPRVRIVVRPTRDDYTPTVGEVAAVVRALEQRAADHRRRLEMGRPTLASRRRQASAVATITQRAAAMSSHALALEVLAATGLRRGELVSLHAGALTRRGDAVALVVEGKTGRRVVPLLDPLGARLEAHAAARAQLWTDRDASALEKLLPRVCAEVGCAPWSVQALRRLAVDRLYGSGADPGEAAAILGHSPQVALRHYRRPRGEDLEAAIRAAGLGTLPGGEVIEFASRRR